MKTTIIHTIRRGISGKSSFRRWPLAAVLAALLLAVAFSPSVAGSPHSAFYSTDNNQIFWFIHASDLHVGTSGSTDSNNLNWLVTTAKSAINPSFIVVTGDLTDSTNGNIFGYPNGPYQAEWDQYKSIVDGKVTAGILLRHPGKPRRLQRCEFRLLRSQFGPGPGNERQETAFLDPELFLRDVSFPGGEHGGQLGRRLQHLLPLRRLCRSRLVGTHLHRPELAANTAASLTLVFGHHPLAPTGKSSDTYLYYGPGSVRKLPEHLRGVPVRLRPHARLSESFYTASMTEGVFYFNVSSLGKDSPNQFTVTAIDCNGIASVTQAVGTWPVVLITAPMDKNLGKNVNPYTYSVTNSAANPIRALVFDTGTVNQVQYRIDMAGSWYPMQRTSGTNYPHLWEALWNASALASGEHTIEVQASTASGVRTDTVKVNVQATQTQQKAGVTDLITGKYAKRSTNPGHDQSALPGGFHRLPGHDQKLQRPARGRRHGQHCRHRPQGHDDPDGPQQRKRHCRRDLEDLRPVEKINRHPQRGLHGHGQRRDGKRLCLGCDLDIQDVHNTIITFQRIGSANPPLSPFAKRGTKGDFCHRFPPRSSLTPSLEKGGQGRIFSFPNPDPRSPSLPSSVFFPTPEACSL